MSRMNEHSSWDRVFGLVKDQLPKFNDHLLVHYRNNELNYAPEYIRIVFEEAVKFRNDPEFKFVTYRELTPEERMTRLVNMPIKQLCGKFDINRNECSTFEYIFEYRGERLSAYIQLPYMINNTIILGGKEWFIQLAIVEKLIYQINQGVIVKVMRAPIHFWRRELFNYSSESGKVYHDDIVTVKIHHKSRRRKKTEPKTALILYLLAEFGLINTLNKFGINPEDAEFVTEYPTDFRERRDYEFFKVKSRIEKDGLWLKVRTDVLNNPIQKRVIASILYIVSFFQKISRVSVYRSDNLPFKIILGKCISDMATKEELAHSNAVTHQHSLLTYLDPIVKDQLKKMGIVCNDIYDLLQYMFVNIDSHLISHNSNNLFEKKITVLDLLLSSVVKAIFNKFYDHSRERVINEKTERKFVRNLSMNVLAIYACRAARTGTSIYNANMLIGALGKRMRHSADAKRASPNSKEYKHHYSASLIETILTIPSSSPIVTGSINPYAMVDDDGYFIEPNDSERHKALQTAFSNQ